MKIRISQVREEEELERVATISVEDCFIWTGVLKAAPEWLTDMILEEEAMVSKTTTKMLSIKHKNGYAQADVGDIIIRVNKNNYAVIHV